MTKKKSYRTRNRNSFIQEDGGKERDEAMDEVGLSVMSWSGQEIKYVVGSGGGVIITSFF